VRGWADAVVRTVWSSSAVAPLARMGRRLPRRLRRADQLRSANSKRHAPRTSSLPNGGETPSGEAGQLDPHGGGLVRRSGNHESLTLHLASAGRSILQDARCTGSSHRRSTNCGSPSGRSASVWAFQYRTQPASRISSAMSSTETPASAAT